MSNFDRDMKKYIHFSLAVMLAVATSACNRADWSKEELSIINASGELLRVLTVDNPEDSLFLRRPCEEIAPATLGSQTLNILGDKMLATVTSPEQDGVGIAGPQVGISRRIVAVQRFDKQGEPFEVYPNIRIIARNGETVPGPEGCLSVPGRRGEVPRYQQITISYSLPPSGKLQVRDTTENISGFTAVIFQHECDHLDGVLYTDYLD